MNCNTTEEEIQTFIAKRLTTTNESVYKHVAIVLVGGPGSGKSLIKNNILEKLNMPIGDFVNIDPDEILTWLFLNDNRCRKKVNEINDFIYETAINEKKNIIFDGTGKDFNWYSEHLLKRLTDEGYSVNLAISIGNVDEALKRIRERAALTGRDVSDEYTVSVYDSLHKTIPQYVSLDCKYVNTRIFVFNNVDKLNLIFQTHCDGSTKSVECIGNICDIDKKLSGGKSKSHRKKNNKSKTNRRH